MNFADFELRAWKKGTDRVQVMVHRSPAGDSPAPIDVRIPAKRLKDLAAVNDVFDATDAGLADIGEQLAALVLPDAINGLLDDSLRSLPAGDGLRVRLSLDPGLQALPWELLHRAPAARGRGVLDGFLALDPRVSIVRGAPAAAERQAAPLDRPRLVFAGALAADDVDQLQVRPEFEGLSRALAPMAQLISLESAIGTAGRVIEQALSRPTSVFHYAGHAEIETDRAYLVKEFEPGNRAALLRHYGDAARDVVGGAGRLHRVQLGASAVRAAARPGRRARDHRRARGAADRTGHRVFGPAVRVSRRRPVDRPGDDLGAPASRGAAPRRPAWQRRVGPAGAVSSPRATPGRCSRRALRTPSPASTAKRSSPPIARR